MMHFIIKDFANNLVKKHGTRDPFELVKRMNIQIVYYPLVDVNGLCHPYKDSHIIYINSRLSNNEKRVVCTHEIGHIIMHKNYNYFTLDQIPKEEKEILEEQADLFASELLISDTQYQELSLNADGEKATLDEIDQNIQDLRVDSKTFLWKVRNFQKAQEIGLHKSEPIEWCYDKNPLKIPCDTYTKNHNKIYNKIFDDDPL